jgi:hypothetical protein
MQNAVQKVGVRTYFDQNAAINRCHLPYVSSLFTRSSNGVSKSVTAPRFQKSGGNQWCQRNLLWSRWSATEDGRRVDDQDYEAPDSDLTDELAN